MKLSPSRIKRDFLGLIDSMSPGDVARSKGDFTRNRLCPLHDTLKLLLTMEGHTMNTEIDNYFLDGKRIPPSKSAFCQQRAKLNDDTLPLLFDMSKQLFPFEKKFRGLHLLAVDGSDVNIPACPGDTSTFIPYNSNNGGYHQLHLNCIYDLLENRYLDIISTPRGELNENRDFCRMVDRNSLRGSLLYIADRGYCAYNTFAHIMQKGQFFLIRAREPSSHGSVLNGISLPSTDEFDIGHSFIITRGYVRPKDRPVYRRLPGNSTFDFIDVNDKHSEFRIPLRIIKVQISDDGYEYLLTNLPKSRFSTSVIKDLYHMRWGIETSFRSIKYALALTCFHSRKRCFIVQEIYARLIMYNFISLILSCFKVKSRDTKYVYVIAFSESVNLCRKFLLSRISAATLKNLLLKALIPIRPGRNYPRKVRSQRLIPFNNRY